VKKFPKFITDPAFKNRLFYGTDWPLPNVMLKGLSLIPYQIYDSILFRLLNKKQIEELRQIKNVFDRDVRLKEFLGADDSVFTLGDRVLKLGI
jgi:hypothetical protein